MDGGGPETGSLMSGEEIPDPDHVARHCSVTKMKQDGTVSGAAFRLRAGKDVSLSVNWLEFLHPDERGLQLAALRDAFRAKGFELRPTARFAVLNAGELRRHVRQQSGDGRVLKVQHEPLSKATDGIDDPSHAGISGYGADDDIIADLIAQAVEEVYAAGAGLQRRDGARLGAGVGGDGAPGGGSCGGPGPGNNDKPRYPLRHFWRATNGRPPQRHPRRQAPHRARLSLPPGGG